MYCALMGGVRLWAHGTTSRNEFYAIQFPAVSFNAAHGTCTEYPEKTMGELSKVSNAKLGSAVRTRDSNTHPV